jgi:hypothetical protein
MTAVGSGSEVGWLNDFDGIVGSTLRFVMTPPHRPAASVDCSYLSSWIAVEEIVLPIEKDGLETDDPAHPERFVDIIISEWMGYFLLRESMLDSLLRDRNKFVKPATGQMYPSHCTMYLAPVQDEEERRTGGNEYSGANS